MKAALFFLLLPSVALAEFSPVIQPEAQPYHRAVVRVHAGKYSGSGTLVAVDGKGTGLILTCNHVIQGARPHTVKFAGDRRDFPARLVATEQQRDLAALHVYVPADVEPIPLAPERPAIGETVELCGYGGRRWGVTRGTMQGVFSHILPSTDIGISHTSIPGESGGPILSFIEGKPYLAGVNWGGLTDQRYEDTPMRFSQGAGSKPILWWLKQRVARQLPWVIE